MPDLRTVPDVELVRVGTYSLDTGDHTFTKEELAHAVQWATAGRGPQPRVKIGFTQLHGATRANDPALGNVANMRLVEDGDAVRGDLVGVPAWLADILPSAYATRSIEATTTTDGQMRIGALELLGVTAPGVRDIEDLRALYDEAPRDLILASGPDADERVITVAVARQSPAVDEVPPAADEIALRASINVDDIRDAFRRARRPTASPSAVGAYDEDWWNVEEIRIDPDELIVEHNSKDGSKTYRVPWSANPDEEGTFVFGEMRQVERRYVDVDTNADPPTVVYAAGAYKESQHKRASDGKWTDGLPGKGKSKVGDMLRGKGGGHYKVTAEDEKHVTVKQVRTTPGQQAPDAKAATFGDDHKVERATGETAFDGHVSKTSAEIDDDDPVVVVPATPDFERSGYDIPPPPADAKKAKSKTPLRGASPPEITPPAVDRPDPERHHMDPEVLKALAAKYGLDPGTATEDDVNAAVIAEVAAKTAEAAKPADTQPAPTVDEAATAVKTAAGEAEAKRVADEAAAATAADEAAAAAAATAQAEAAKSDPIAIAAAAMLAEVSAEVAELRADKQARIAAETIARRDGLANDWVQDGRLEPTSYEHYRGLLDVDEGRTIALAASLAPGRVPVAVPIAASVADTTVQSAEDALYALSCARMGYTPIPQEA